MWNNQKQCRVVWSLFLLAWSNMTWLSSTSGSLLPESGTSVQVLRKGGLFV